MASDPVPYQARDVIIIKEFRQSAKFISVSSNQSFVDAVVVDLLFPSKRFLLTES